MAPSRRVIVLVRGRVQGVFFRAACASAATARGVEGWVRNRPDGCVEAAFEGDTDAVAEMVAWCRGGPPGASVGEVVVRDEAPMGERGFRITG